jgi:RHS repeat-associated protein
MEFEWDLQYRLKTVAVGGTPVESYQYDAGGRRIATTSGTNVVRHVYDGLHVVADTDAAGNVLRSYTWGPGIDNLLAMTVYGPGGTNTYQAISDHLGTVHALVTPGGTVAERYEYDAWGNVLGVYDSNGNPLTSDLGLPTSALNNRYLFQGREYSWATHAAWGGAGLYYFRARWYDPSTGRWLSNDPIGISGGLNQYAFCANNPVMFVDPDGLKWDRQINNLHRAEKIYNNINRDPVGKAVVESVQSALADNGAIITVRTSPYAKTGYYRAGGADAPGSVVLPDKPSNRPDSQGRQEVTPEQLLIHELWELYLWYTNPIMSEEQRHKCALEKETEYLDSIGAPRKYYPRL